LKFLTNIDLSKNELQNARIQNLATPPANPVPGQIYYNTTDKVFYGWNGTTWINLSELLTQSKIVAALGYTPIKNGGSTPELRAGTEASRPAATGSGMVYFATDTKKIWKDTAPNTWTQMGGQDTIDWSAITGKPSTFTPPIASPTQLGGIKVGANLTILPDGTLNANDNPASFIRKQERFTVTAGQTVFNLTKGTYKPGTGAITWFLDGIKQDDKAMTETSPTSVTLPAGLPEGSEVMFEYYEVINWHPFPNHANEHLTGGADPIPLATPTSDGLMPKDALAKLNGIAAGAEVNQNTFANVKVGATTIAADSKTDTLELVAGSGITLTPDATNDKVTIAANAASTSAPGIVQLNDTVTSTSTSQAATANAAKQAYDRAVSAENNAKSYTDTKIASLVNSAPGTLDTLQELATALGNDPNFATTITNQLALRTKKYVASIGDGTATNFTITHNLGTQDVAVTIRENASPYNVVFADVQITDANNIKVLFATAPSSNQYRVVVVG
jgi:Phage tail fibre repeat